ncbi:hypothetical protein H2203_008332 [Taxawa tesnikishii (nom. ined.)]|nr:hypothetical protein H2203_008332 [Dothideales sp. JES 119]
MAGFHRQSTGIEVIKQLSDQVKGKTYQVLITGTSAGGLGAETAISLAHGSPAHVLLLARSANKVDPVISAIRDVDPEITTTFMPVSLDSFSSVLSAVETVKAKTSKLNILINNAGIMAAPYSQNGVGIESQLTAAGPGARIINVASDGYTNSPFRFDDWNFSEARLMTPGPVHPGVIFDTSLAGHLDPASFGEISEIALKNTGVPFRVGEPKTVQQGVATTLVAALNPGSAESSGSYLEICTIHPLRSYASSTDNSERLWNLSEKLVGRGHNDVEVWQGLE